jgi:type I restriction enzyme, S subunit
MKQSWVEKQISEMYRALYDGPHATPSPSDSGKLFLRIENITSDGRLDFSSPTFISNEEFPRWTRRVVPQKGDIVFSYEATLGRYAVIPEGFEGCLGRRIALIRPDFQKAHPKFLHYYFYSDLWASELNNYLVTGATVDRIPLLKFPQFKVSAPPISIQRKIAAVLSAYDDLIENNNRRIALLEKMAEELYCEWFVRLRFPSYESTKIVKGVPEGWTIQQMSNLCGIIDCLHTKKPEIDPHGEGWLLQLENIGKNGRFVKKCRYMISAADYKEWIKNIELKEGDCLVTNVGRIGAVTQIPKGVKAAPGRNMTAIRPSRITKTFLFQYLLSPHMMLEVAKKQDFGAIMGALNVRAINKLEILLPPLEILDKFELNASPMRKKIARLQEANDLLEESRDRLLTRLMSGKIDLDAFDIAVPPRMQEAA